MFNEPANSPWYEDGIEGNEQCWRLDVTPNVQFQLFAKTDDEERTRPDYHTARLFYEKDVREDGNPDNRIHYACGSFPITDEEAVALLTQGEEALRTIMADLLAEIDTLPNQPEYCGTCQEQWATA